MRLQTIETGLISEATISKLTEEIEYKYLANYTNINNIKQMLADIRRAMTVEWADLKTLEIAFDEQNNLLESSIKATKLHKKNLVYLENL